MSAAARGAGEIKDEAEHDAGERDVEGLGHRRARRKGGDTQDQREGEQERRGRGRDGEPAAERAAEDQPQHERADKCDEERRRDRLPEEVVDEE